METKRGSSVFRSKSQGSKQQSRRKSRSSRGKGRRKGRKGRNRKGSKGTKSNDHCICPNCGEKVPHQRGVPCIQQTCPSCGTKMVKGGVGRAKSRSIPSRTESRSKSTAKISKSDQSNLESYDHPIVDKEKCIGCGVCVENCPMDAIVIKEGKAEIKSEKCSNCRKCVSACPQDAIG